MQAVPMLRVASCIQALNCLADHPREGWVHWLGVCGLHAGGDCENAHFEKEFGGQIRKLSKEVASVVIKTRCIRFVMV